MNADDWRTKASRLDAQDELRDLRGHFHLPADEIYLDANSLGLLSTDAEQAVLEELGRWRELGVGGWAQGDPSWFHLSEHLGELSAEVVGAQPEEVVVTGSTTVNLHQLLATFYRPRPGRSAIVIDQGSFPTDHYAAESHLRLLGLDPGEALREVAPRGDFFEEHDITDAFSGDVALAILPAVLYRSGQFLDVPALTEAARTRGVLLGWDLAHAAGAVELRLHDWQVDFAFWCNYKHLAGGPGASGSLFVHERHFDRAPGMWGWFGSRKSRQFDMATTFTPARGAGSLQTGTPHILSLAALKGALGLVLSAGMAAIRRKSLLQTDLMIAMADDLLAAHGFSLGTPREPWRRGAHVALRHLEATRITRALKAQGVIPDFRPPDIVRLGPSMLHTSFADIAEAMLRLDAIMQEGRHLKEPPGRGEIA